MASSFTGRSRARALALLLAATALTPGPLLARTATASTAEDALAAGFRDPPASARPRVWWHWAGPAAG